MQSVRDIPDTGCGCGEKDAASVRGQLLFCCLFSFLFLFLFFSRGFGPSPLREYARRRLSGTAFVAKMRLRQHDGRKQANNNPMWACGADKGVGRKLNRKH
jgi:hypothetical protein